MLREVETLDFMFHIHTDTDDQIHNLKQNESDNCSQRPGNDDGNKLVNNLTGMTVNQSRRKNMSAGILEDRVDHTCSKNTGQQCAYGSADSVHSKGVQGIIISEFVFDRRNHEVADHACHHSNHQRRHGADKARGGRDGDQPSAAAAAPNWVATKALLARLPAARALPALKPNHPTQSRQAPIKLSTTLWGGIGSCG